MKIDFYLDLDKSNPDFNMDMLKGYGMSISTKPGLYCPTMDRIKITVDLPDRYFNQIAADNAIVTNVEKLDYDNKLKE